MKWVELLVNGNFSKLLNQFCDSWALAMNALEPLKNHLEMRYDPPPLFAFGGPDRIDTFDTKLEAILAPYVTQFYCYGMALAGNGISIDPGDL